MCLLRHFLGGSAGGNIAAGISHELKSTRFQPMLEAQILLSPALQVFTSSFFSINLFLFGWHN